jgi:hypothetical protein
MNSHICPSASFDKSLKTSNGEKIVSSTNVAEKTGYPHAEN